ncbi:dynactin p62 [Daedalea quercina L-15889]|uniref:Dynactin subunit 4 n=1 Tax=Daedalea quercina L-15889 TaxID=1314783 RepID=A0A165NR59_9APHY|nr:dynactin p62 [Daedalea quercina L-15889]
MAPSVEYYCPCLAASPHPPPPHLPSSSYSFHPLHNLFFCEECDAVRCNRCVMVEVSGYYCPNCLFEVPSASVRAEKNRCARNCFLCPNCRNTLTVVPSDPPNDGLDRTSPIVSTSLGEPPFFLFCNYCRWDSAEVGITFEKPTGLAAQLQKYEDSAPEALEFDRLKEHFEPFLRASSSSSAITPSSSHHHSNPITAAASSALARDIPGVGKYNPLTRSRSGRDKGAHKTDIPDYKARVEVGSAAGLGAGGGEADAEFVRHLETVAEVATVEQRWVNSWASSLHTGDLKPLRIPLQSKKSKRCPSCRHILIKPEQKAQSVRYKIKLVAANYLPAISVSLPHARVALEMMKRSALNRSTAQPEDQNPAAAALLAGKTYSFHLSFTNPLYDPIQVRLKKAQAMPTPGSEAIGEKAKRPPFQVNLPSAAFPIAAFAEAWEYEDDEDMFGLEDDDDLDGLGRLQKDSRGKARTVGVVEKKANVTVVAGEVILTKEARGNVKFNMLVSYTYRSDDPDPTEGNETGTPSRHASNKQPEMKNFSFYTVVDLGPIVPREETRHDTDL